MELQHALPATGRKVICLMRSFVDRKGSLLIDYENMSDMPPDSQKCHA